MNAQISAADIALAKQVSLPDLISRHVKLKRRGNDWWGVCPFHSEKTGSFHVTRDFYKCFGCGAGGDAITWIRETERLGFVEAVARLAGKDLSPSKFAPAPERQPEKPKRRKVSREREIWGESVPLSGTHAEAYLLARCIRVPPCDALRFHAGLFHSESEQRLPALVALLSDDRGVCAIQRTFLDPALPRKAAVEKNKKALGEMGASSVRLRHPTGDVLGLAEGVETALSAAQIYSVPVWAVCGAHRFTKIEIPETIRIVHIFGDPGEIGREFAFKAADFWEEKGLHAEVYFPSAHYEAGHSDDFNDVLTKGAPRAA